MDATRFLSINFNMFHDGITILMIFNFLIGYIHAPQNSGETFVQTSTRANTLIDDADDIQKQLDNEARDRMKFGRPKTVWVLHFPTHLRGTDSIEDATETSRRSNRDLISRYLHGSHLLDLWTTPSGTYTDENEHFHNINMNITKLHDEIHKILAESQLNKVLGPIPPSNADWDYKTQHLWHKSFPACGGYSQSPVDLPVDSLVRVKSSVLRKLKFFNYDVAPLNLKLNNDGKRIVLIGVWPKKRQPLVHGGAANSRRYLFHSMTFHWPSEHLVGGLQYPVETQALHISAEYNSFDDAVNASGRDPMAFLGIANLYRYSPVTQSGLDSILKRAIKMGIASVPMPLKPLEFFNPPFQKYVCYHGSLTFPPCTESVLWFVRSKALPVTRDTAAAASDIFNTEDIPRVNFIRRQQPKNDRRLFLFS